MLLANLSQIVIHNYCPTRHAQNQFGANVPKNKKKMFLRDQLPASRSCRLYSGGRTL